MTERREPSRKHEISRRGFLKGAGLGIAAGGLLGAAREGVRGDAGPSSAPVLGAEEVHDVEFTLNGQPAKASVRTGHTLLETLRDQLRLTGTKEVCDMGSCGACAVLLDGRPVNSCLTLAADVRGRRVETVEGLARNGRLHPLQAAFCEHDALQCGFCTPGMLISCKALLDRNPSPSIADTKEAIAGNICRCGTYINIFDAVQTAARTLNGGK